MTAAAITFDRVWKKFRRGERHDSLRDLVPEIAKRAFGRTTSDELGDQEFWVLKDVSFTVNPGEVVGIIGRNGAGKSTTLKVLNRILKPNRGRMLVRGRVGALIELAAGFHPDLTGRENVNLQGAIMGMRRSEIRARFDEIVDFAGVGSFIDTPVKRYSSGMNARLGFSIAAFLRPDVLLIDEVLAVGDVSFQQKCFARLKEFREEGLAICFVSHNMQAITSLCDRVVYLRGAEVPLVTDVEQAVSAYLAADRSSADVRLRLVHTQLTQNGQDVSGHLPLEPGCAVRLEVTVTSTVRLPAAGFGVVVQRSDGLAVFDAVSIVEGGAPIDIEPGMSVTFAVRLSVNLGKGIYTILGRLVNQERTWPLAELGVLGSFAVNSPRRYATIAEMEPRFEEARPAAAEVPRV